MRADVVIVGGERPRDAFGAQLSGSAQPGIPFAMEKGRFAVFFPWDAGSGVGRKLVVKAAL